MPGLRLWSISPSYLDARGLLALWREALLAQKALMGLTRGYTRHPQLERFRRTSDPVLYIGTYLYYVYLEGRRRGYDFNLGKIVRYDPGLPRVPLTAPALNNGGSAPTGAFPLTSQAPPRALHHSSGPAVSLGEARAHGLLSSPAP